MPKCLDCQTKFESIEKIKEKCPNEAWCTYICPECEREIPIESTNNMTVVVTQRKPVKWINVCSECGKKMRKEIQPL